MGVLNTNDKKHKPNYYVILPDGSCSTIYIKDMEAAKKILLQMNERVRLLKIKK